MPRTPLPLIALVLAVAACGPEGQRPDDMPVVVSAIGGPRLFADPNAGPLTPAQDVALTATAQGLVRFDANGQIEPALAERWNVIDDARSYIFRLGDATWPDGEPVTAGEVVRALRRATAQASRSRLAEHLAVIDEIVEMTPQVIEVRLKHPRPDLLNLFAQPEMAVFRPRSFTGTGPFRVVDGKRAGLLLEPARLPEEEGDPKPPPETMVRLHGERAARAVARFRKAASDLVLGGTIADWPLVGQAGIAAENIHFDPATGLFGLAVTRPEGFLASADNRAAIAMAIDRAALTGALAPKWSATETLLPAQLDSAAPPARPAWAELDADARLKTARERVAAWRKANPGRIEIAIALPAGPGATRLWGYLAASLIRVGLDPRRVAIDDPGAALKLIDAVAPYDSARWYLATACQRCSEDAATLIAAARDAPDLYNRQHRIAEADALLTAENSFIPIAQPLRWSIVALRLSAWQGNARAVHPLNHLRKE
ncbi:ABC transporter substrate-binding protein [Sphingomonas sp. RS6]